MNAEQTRLHEAGGGLAPWRKWGAYVSERQWGTVREDYSADGSAWEYFPHEHARSRAYRWGEDAIGGLCDAHQRLVVAPAFWNEKDAILKERFFGLTNHEGNHGEDVKELYYYLDATPTGSYLKMLYKYPQARFPYERLVAENCRRGRNQREFELLDTGVFDEGKYFDIVIEYAKASGEDILMLVTAHNRGPRRLKLHVVLQAWFRNTWSWSAGTLRPQLALTNGRTVEARHEPLGTYILQADGRPEWLFCENDTNARRLFGTRAEGFFKDAFHEYIVGGDSGAVNPAHVGTKAGARYKLIIAAGESASVRLRMHRAEFGPPGPPFDDFEAVFAARRDEADAFYADLQQGITDEDVRRVQRQALAGMIWGRQYYHWDVRRWLDGDPALPPPAPQRRQGRNWQWQHLNNDDVIAMPDTWEYPWYAAWDLAFHSVAQAMIDPDFAKSQLVLLTREWYMHPNGQLPAYEWGLGQANPPVHAWAAWRVFQIDRRARGDAGDLAFLERVFHKLLLNFTWWVNRKDAHGRNVFQGGFLGLDNIGVFDRDTPLPDGGQLDQADATSWMAMYSLNLMRIAIELALHNPVYQDMATKFFEHFLEIARAMTNMADAGLGLWDEVDGFYYDAIATPDGRTIPLRLRSVVGLIPLFAVETIEPETLERLPAFAKRMAWFLEHRPELAALVSRWTEPGRGDRRLLSLLRGHRMKCLLRRLLDETEFLSPYGVRSLSRYHLDHPYEFACHGRSFRVGYEPGESASAILGGNSNWRGPVWMPINFLLIESLQKFHHYYGDDFQIECPTGSGRLVTILQVAEELTARLTRLFLRGPDGRRPALGDHPLFQTDEHFREGLLFHEHFDGDTGRGLGACHQTGWTGLIAKLLQPRQGPR